MEVNFNPDTLYRMTGVRYFKHVSLNPEKDGRYDNIVLYLIKNNDPNYLLKTITIDPAELIEEGYIVFDIFFICSELKLVNNSITLCSSS